MILFRGVSILLGFESIWLGSRAKHVARVRLERSSPIVRGRTRVLYILDTTRRADPDVRHLAPAAFRKG
eukprot:4346609-Pyramimonas_sp.AAC.1